jgi:hypothetical protein
VDLRESSSDAFVREMREGLGVEAALPRLLWGLELFL